jgi:hypothetical protein
MLTLVVFENPLELVGDRVEDLAMNGAIFLDQNKFSRSPWVEGHILTTPWSTKRRPWTT